MILLNHMVYQFIMFIIILVIFADITGYFCGYNWIYDRPHLGVA